MYGDVSILRKCQNITYVILYSLSRKFNYRLFGRPEFEKLHFRVFRPCYAFLFRSIHGIVHQRIPYAPSPFDVHPHRGITDGTYHRLVAVARVEVDVRELQERRFAVRSDDKVGSLVDAILLLQGLKEQEVSRGTLPSPCQVLVAHCHLPSPFGKGKKQPLSLLSVQGSYVIAKKVHVSHLLSFCPLSPHGEGEARLFSVAKIQKNSQNGNVKSRKCGVKVAKCSFLVRLSIKSANYLLSFLFICNFAL